MELKKPFLVLCDHIHEAQGTDTLDGSFIVNPGPVNRNQYATVEVDVEIEVEFHISSCSKKKRLKSKSLSQRYDEVEENELSVKKDDFILVDYVVRIKETEEIFDTTIAAEAEKGEIFKDNVIYEPMFIIVGKEWVLKKLDASLIGLEVDAKTVIEIPPEDGFGLRDPAQLKVIPISRFRKQDISPYPGAQIELDGKTAVVRSVGAGRVQVDYNPPLAGKTLIYDLNVKKIIEDDMDKIKCLIHRRIPSVNVEAFKLTVAEKELTIEIPEEAFYLQGVQYAKRGIASDLQMNLSSEKVTFTEVFTKPEPDHSPSEEQSKQDGNSPDIQPAP